MSVRQHGRLLTAYQSFDLIEARSDADAVALSAVGSVPADYLKRISFLQASFDPLAMIPEVPSEFRASAADPAATSASLHIVQFRGPVLPGWKEELGSRVDILHYIPQSAYIVRADADAIAGVRSLPDVRWVGAYQPWYKVEPALHVELGAEAVSRALVDIHPFASPADLREVAELLVIERVEVSPWRRTLIGKLHQDDLGTLVGLDAVSWVQRYHDGEILNGEAQWVVQSGQNGQRPVWDKGLHGEGQVVGYGDTGLDYDHIFYRNVSGSNLPGPGHRKVVGYKQWDPTPGDAGGHGTHVAGSIAGNDKPLGGTSANIGQAYEAKLFVDDVYESGGWAAPADLNIFYQESFNASARIHSNSWGYPSEHTYTQASSTTDQWMWNHKDDGLVVIAAGNERGQGMDSLRSPGLAKNIVTVGATQNGASHQSMATFSSTGPTNPDGRLKPTICAPGVDIRSAQSDGDLGTNNAGETQMSGTSMATPTTAGVLATMRQYFTEGWYPSGAKTVGDEFVPTPALLKAVLMAGATEITGAGSDDLGEMVYPNNSQGWGLVNSTNSLYFASDAQRLAIWEEKTGINTGETRTYDFDVSSTAQMVRVIVVWTDYYGAVNANPAIVNDLDLEVTDPSGTKYLGNNFAGQNPGHSVTGGQPDRKNVEEGVLIPNPTFGLKTGKWSIMIRGQNAPQGPQPYAIAITGDVRGGGMGSSLSRIDVAPPNANINADQTKQFTATAFDVNGNQTNATFVWNSSGGTVSPAGLYTPGPVGTFQVTAKAGGKVGLANITVTPGALVSVAVNPPTANVSAGATQVFSATGRDAKGNPIIIQSNWTASIGTIDATGSFTAPTTLGTGTITATERTGGLKGTATVNIVAGPVASLDVDPKGSTVPADQTLQFTAKGVDQHGNPTPANPTWTVTSGAMSVAGLYTPDKVGVQTVTARENAATATAQVTVVAGKIVSIVVEPAVSSITADETLALTAKGQDSKGNSVVITPTWSATLGTVATDGTYTPDKTGTATVTASSSGVNGIATVTVNPGRLAVVELLPSQATISADNTLPLEAKGKDAKGNGVTLAGNVQWSVEKGSIVPSGAKATYRPQESGVWNVTAATSGVSGVAIITVTPGRLSDVVVSPESVELVDGDSAKFEARGFDVNGNEIKDADLEWEVTDRLGTITKDGVFTATKAGDGKVIAKVTKGADTQNGQALVKVASPAPLEAFFRLVGGQTNGLLLIALIIGLVVAAAVAAAVSRRRKRAQEEAVRDFYATAPAQGAPPGSYSQSPPPPPPPPEWQTGPPPAYISPPPEQ